MQEKPGAGAGGKRLNIVAVGREPGGGGERMNGQQSRAQEAEFCCPRCCLSLEGVHT